MIKLFLVLQFMLLPNPAAETASDSPDTKTLEAEFKSAYAKHLGVCPDTLKELRGHLISLDQFIDTKIKKISKDVLKNLLYEKSIAGQIITLIAADKVPEDVPFSYPAQECNKKYREFQATIQSKGAPIKLNDWVDCIEIKNNEVLLIAKQIESCYEMAKK